MSLSVSVSVSVSVRDEGFGLGGACLGSTVVGPGGVPDTGCMGLGLRVHWLRVEGVWFRVEGVLLQG